MTPAICVTLSLYAGAVGTLLLLLASPYGTAAAGQKFLPGFIALTRSSLENSSAEVTIAGNLKGDWLPWGNSAVYAYGLTVAEIRTSADDGHIEECKLTELQDPADCDPLAKKLGKPVVNICFERMMELIAKCRALVKTKKSPFMALSFNQWNRVWNGIFPGTKWCGSGDIAANYDDLGVDAALDKCCRAHDLCPVKLRAFRRGHGLVNFSLYTKSHCECDADFRRCLLHSDSDSAVAVGNVYFNVLRVPCIREVNQTQSPCKSDSTTISEECLNEDQRQVPMKFFSTEESYPLPGFPGTTSSPATTQATTESAIQSIQS